VKKKIAIRILIPIVTVTAIFGAGQMMNGIFPHAQALNREYAADVFRTGNQRTYKVANVADGDTIDIEIGGRKERIKLVGAEAPEIITAGTAPGCYGKEAAEKTKEILLNQYVYLEADDSQADSNETPARYIILPDGGDFGKYMIAEGYARKRDNGKPYGRQQEYAAAESEAQKNKTGLWGDCPEENVPLTEQTAT
jgi:endonuclease YncB( thermonuclease family)